MKGVVKRCISVNGCCSGWPLSRLWNEWTTTEVLAFGFTTLKRWWKAGGGIAMRLCGGNVVRGYIIQNSCWSGMGTEGASLRMDIRRARQPYTTLNALWNEWTSRIQQLMCNELGADGYRWPNNCSSDWLDFASRSASQL
ncbi:hypothetical protein T05_11474 [Trichinella murrelli]|uniref:Uncharacterized protein n=1 Tax=Trichinella murrelli TaxID=144512 RepID=A0A0V0T7B7_9BILA|nr:hypothetical protein T05_11474 [Trichinella murrelli]